MFGRDDNSNERIEQLREGSRLARQGNQTLRATLKKKPVLKGHEAYLKALEASGATISIAMLDTESPLIGVIKHSDKYTLSVEPQDGGENVVVFKHAIRSFRALTPRPVEPELH